MKKIKDFIQSLIKEDSTPEFAESVGAIMNEIDKCEREQQELIESHETLRKKYVVAIKQSSFKDDTSHQQESEKAPRTLEEIVNDIAKEK